MPFQCANIDHPIEFIFVVVNKSHSAATHSTSWLHYEIIRFHTVFDVIPYGTLRDVDFHNEIEDNEILIDEIEDNEILVIVK